MKQQNQKSIAYLEADPLYRRTSQELVENSAKTDIDIQLDTYSTNNNIQEEDEGGIQDFMARIGEYDAIMIDGIFENPSTGTTEYLGEIEGLDLLPVIKSMYTEKPIALVSGYPTTELEEYLEKQNKNTELFKTPGIEHIKDYSKMPQKAEELIESGKQKVGLEELEKILAPEQNQNPATC